MKIEANLFAASRQADTQAAANIGGSSTCKSLANTRYHRAAIDGYVDMLCEASKRDTNLASDETGLTPTLLAARQGHLEALRILVGRGGDPERAAADGSSALHLAAARNHLNCVSFLVNFGVNMWSLDNELHTAKDVAAIEQRKEVLDYLDQMMAKQSALNTKSVQKLKEKAKVSAEKRLKQMRKAQLKAIKQVEKDERYLVKLSNNRRLLKAAHSLSDIKLVGRSEASISYAPSDVSGSTYSSEPRPSPSLASHHNKQHLQTDLRSSLAAAVASGRQQLNGFRSHSGANHASNSDESAYGSSISSTSCYLSSGSSSSARFSASEQLKFSTRPKYSDLVAMQTGGLSGSHSDLSRKLLQSTLGVKPNAKRKSGMSATTEQQSLKSNSTIGAKLRGIGGGVSRKVQLKRLLLINTSHHSTSDLTGGKSSGTMIAGGAGADDASNTITATNSQSGEQSTRLCNVQPAIKLKLNGESSSSSSSAAAAAAHQQQTNSRQQQDSNLGNIKWPPAPAMTRAISEPDFSAALRSLSLEEDEEEMVEMDDNEDGENNDSSCHQDERPDDAGSKQPVATGNLIAAGRAQSQNVPAMASKKQLSSSSCNSSSNQNPTMSAPKLSSAESSQTSVKESPTNKEASSSIASGRDESQQHLLTQCLSQLKMRHESISKHYQQSPDQLIQPSKMVDFNRNRLCHQQLQFGNSNELIQHQLNAGRFPLRPSNIKQQQHLHHHANQRFPSGGEQLQHQVGGFQFIKGGGGEGVGVINAADSIGSASSLAKRNSRSPSSKSPSSSSPSSSLFYSSSYASSIEAVKPTSTVATAAVQHQPQPPPPPKQQAIGQLNQTPNSSSALSQCNKSAQAQQQQVRAQISSANETIGAFLMSNGLMDLSEVFEREKIDLEALMLLSEEDLKSLDILLGPRRKLLRAIENRRLIQQRNKMETCRAPLGPMYVMVDTPL